MNSPKSLFSDDNTTFVCEKTELNSPTRIERARQIDQEEFRRESAQALQRALAYSKQKRSEERARVMGIELPREAPKHVATVLNRLGKQARAIEYQGVWMTAAAWAEHLNVSLPAFRRRIRLYGIEAAVAMGSTRPRGWKWRENIGAFADGSIVAPGQDSSFNPLEPACDHTKQDQERGAAKKSVSDHAYYDRTAERNVRLEVSKNTASDYRDNARIEATNNQREQSASNQHRGENSERHARIGAEARLKQNEHNADSKECVTGFADLMRKHHPLSSIVESNCRLHNRSEDRLKAPPGVVSNFLAIEGTGAGSTAQESTEITFSQKAITE